MAMQKQERSLDMLESLLGGDTYKSVASRHGISSERVRQLILWMARMLSGKYQGKYGMIEVGDEFRGYWSLTELRDQKEFWLTCISRYREGLVE